MIIAVLFDHSLLTLSSLANVFTPDVCDWYFLAIALDTTLGVVVNIALLKASQYAFGYTPGSVSA